MQTCSVVLAQNLIRQSFDLLHDTSFDLFISFDSVAISLCFSASFVVIDDAAALRFEMSFWFSTPARSNSVNWPTVFACLAELIILIYIMLWLRDESSFICVFLVCLFSIAYSMTLWASAMLKIGTYDKPHTYGRRLAMSPIFKKDVRSAMSKRSIICFCM